MSPSPSAANPTTAKAISSTRPCCCPTTRPTRRSRTEYFGPILAVHVYADDEFDDVLDVVDGGSRYALTGAVIADDRAAVAARRPIGLRLAAGNFYVNDKPTGAVVGQQPFGGVAGLGHQRQGRLAAEPAALDVGAVDQGDLRPAHRSHLPAHGGGRR